MFSQLAEKSKMVHESLNRYFFMQTLLLNKYEILILTD